MRVCLVTGEYPPMRGGVADYTWFLAEALRSLGVDVLIVTSDNARVRRSESIDAPDSGLLTVKEWTHQGVGRAADIIAEAKPDVVHIQYQTGAYSLHPAVNLLPWRLRLRANRPRVVVTFHDLRTPYLFPKAGPVRSLANASLVSGADAIVATNSEDASRLTRTGSALPELSRWGGRPLARIPIGSNIPLAPPAEFERTSWRERLGVGPDEVLLSFFGFLVPSKGVDLLLEALRLVDNRATRLVMVGGSAADLSVASDRGYEQRIRQLADDQELRGRVIWTGFTEREEVSANLLASDACVLPFTEGASLRHGTLVAALTHGLPIVTTSAAAVPKFRDGLELISGLNCVLCERGNLRALVEGINRVSGSSEERARLASGAREMARAFSWQNIAVETLEVYRSLLP